MRTHQTEVCCGGQKWNQNVLCLKWDLLSKAVLLVALDPRRKHVAPLLTVCFLRSSAVSCVIPNISLSVSLLLTAPPSSNVHCDYAVSMQIIQTIILS